MRFISLFVILFLLVGACGETVHKGAVNFSGEWAFNAEKSDLGFPRDRERGANRDRPREGRRGGMGLTGSRMIIEQNDNDLVVEMVRPNPDGEEFSIKSAYTLDGKKSKNNSNFGSRVSTARWSKDGKTLTIKSTMTIFREDREFNMESTEQWSLDDNTLTIETTRSTPMGEMKSKAVYDKVNKEE
jgi:hypothetical protein